MRYGNKEDKEELIEVEAIRIDVSDRSGYGVVDGVQPKMSPLISFSGTSRKYHTL